MRTPSRPLMISSETSKKLGTQEKLALLSAKGELQRDILIAKQGMEEHHHGIYEVVNLFANRQTNRPAFDRQVKGSFELGAAAGYYAFLLETEYCLRQPEPYVVHHYLKSDGHFSPDEAAQWRQAVEDDEGLKALAGYVGELVGLCFEERQAAVIRGIGLVSCIVNSSVVLLN